MSPRRRSSDPDPAPLSMLVGHRPAGDASAPPDRTPATGPDGDGPPHDAARWPSGRRPRFALVAVVVLVLGVGAWLVRPGPSPTPDAFPSAPTDPVGLRWSLDVGAGGAPIRVEPQAWPVDGDLLVHHTDPGGARGEQVLERRDGATGDLRWSVAVARTDLVVPLGDDGPVGVPGTRFWAIEPGRVRGIDASSGRDRWTLPGSSRSTAVVLGDGSLFVAGDAGCGTVDTRSGRFRFVLEGDECDAWEDGIRWRDGADLVYVDPDGVERTRTVDTGESLPPTLVDDLLVEVDDRVLRARTTAGAPRWALELGAGTWFALLPVDDHHLRVQGTDATVLVDTTAGREVGRLAGSAAGFQNAAGDPRFLADGMGMTDGQAAGVWSRSPDATRLDLYDVGADLLGRAEVVVTGPPLLTHDGVLLAHGPDDDRRLTLLDADDLAIVWDVGVDLRLGRPVASTGDLVAVVGEVDGRQRLDVFAR